jgi:hypothetical protein
VIFFVIRSDLDFHFLTRELRAAAGLGAVEEGEGALACNGCGMDAKAEVMRLP